MSEVKIQDKIQELQDRADLARKLWADIVATEKLLANLKTCKLEVLMYCKDDQGDYCAAVPPRGKSSDQQLRKFLITASEAYLACLKHEYETL